MSQTRGATMAEKDLLEQLRIEEGERRGVGAHRWLWLLASVLVVSALAAAAYHLLLGPTIAVETAVAEPAGSGRAPVLEATGYITARLQATVSSKIAGKLAEVLIEEGESVKAGQVLARLDDTDARAQLDVVHARLEAARAQLGQTRRSSSRRGATSNARRSCARRRWRQRSSWRPSARRSGPCPPSSPPSAARSVSPRPSCASPRWT
jgi:multidrug efflux pump subunit AcrA (membrane-fusion protein)